MKKNIIGHKQKIIIGAIILATAMILLQYIYYSKEKLTAEDVIFSTLAWSEWCDGKVYTQEERDTFCAGCRINGTCSWPLDMTFTFPTIHRIINTGGELHCHQIIDGTNYYNEHGRYYGITNTSLFTWEVLNAAAHHTITLCCNIERTNILSTVFHAEGMNPQHCVTKEIIEFCGG